MPVDQIKDLFKHPINVFGVEMVTKPDETMSLINFVAKQGTTTIDAVFRQCPTADRPRLWRTAGWLIKLGIFKHGGE
jgi:hypothetical protein